MKFHLILDPDREESVVVTARERSSLTDAIEALVRQPPRMLTGYREGTGFRLSPESVCCIIAEDEKVFALTDEGKYHLRERLYQIEEQLPDFFLRINRSAIANLRKIRRFAPSISGTLQIVYSNGYRDYVSRRNLKRIKQALEVKR